MSEDIVVRQTLHWADRHKKKQAPQTPPPMPPAVRPAGRDRYAEAAFQSELDRLAVQGEGGRNEQLNKSAFALNGFVAAARLDGRAVWDDLKSVALSIGLPEGEVNTTLASARKGLGFPRYDNLPGADSGAAYDPSDLVAPHGQMDTADGQAVDLDDLERTSWWPLPIGERVAADAEIPGPTHLIREDGQALLYSGKINGLLGESESGKSWVALYGVVQALGEGQRVLFLDFEDSAESIFGRLRSMGAQVNVGTLDYANPAEGLGLAQSRDLREALDAQAYRLVVVDGVNAAMTLLGYDINSNTDATMFAQKLLAPLAATGACVLTVDHVPKSADARGRGGIGAQAKRAMMTGAALSVEVQEPFGRGQSGVLKLTVDKDRPGHVRGASAGSKFAGRAYLDSDGDRVRMRIEAAGGGEFAGLVAPISMLPTAVMEKVSLLIEKANEAPSFRNLVNGAKRREATVKEAVDALVDLGCIRVEKGPNGASSLHHLVRPYREDEHVAGPKLPTGDPSPDRLRETVGDGRGPSPKTVSPPSLQGGDGLGGGSGRPDPRQGWSSCNRCGEAVLDTTLDETAGYCVPCGRVMNP